MIGPTRMFSLTAFINDLNADLNGPEISWDFRLDTTLIMPSVKTGRMRVAIRFPIRLYGSRKAWVRNKVIAVAEKHGLLLDDPIEDEDFCLCGCFSDLLAERI